MKQHHFFIDLISFQLLQLKEIALLWCSITLLFPQRMATSSNISISNQILRVEDLIKDRQALEKIVQNFKFNEELTIQNNLSLLSSQLVTYFQIGGAYEQSLRSFFVEKNLPIEVNLRPLKANQLANLLSEWIGLSSECSLTNQRLYTTSHRNSLFIAVFQQQQEIINDYFSINPNNMLIADDIFNLLQEMLSPYFLYDSKTDKLTFFEKENSLSLFKEIVQKFSHHDHRILFSQSENSQYVRKLEFQKLIEFWENLNPDLALLTHARRCGLSAEAQTGSHETRHTQVQASQLQPSLLDFLDQTLEKLNEATVYSQSPKDLQSIERLYAFLKNEKEKLLVQRNQAYPQLKQSYKKGEQKAQKLKPIVPKAYSSLSVSSQDDRTIKISNKITQSQCWKLQKTLTQKSPTIDIKHKHKTKETTTKIQTSFQNSLMTIYQHYKNEQSFTMTTLKKCLNDMKLIYQGQSELMTNLIKKGLIKNILQISFIEFRNSIEWILSVNPITHKKVKDYSNQIEIKRQAKLKDSLYLTFNPHAL